MERAIADMLGGVTVFGWMNREGGGDNKEESKGVCQREAAARERKRERGRESTRARARVRANYDTTGIVGYN